MPDPASGNSLHFFHLAKKIAGEVNKVNAVVEQGAASHHVNVMHPRVSKLLASRMTGVAANVVKLTNHARVKNLPRFPDGGVEPVVEARRPHAIVLRRSHQHG